MADIDFDDRFVTAVNTNGEKQRIPAHWLDHPVLGRGFRPAPSQAARDADSSGQERSETPDSTWTVNALRAHALKAGIDLGDARTKDDILTALDTQTPDATEASDETPAAGDEKEN